MPRAIAIVFAALLLAGCTSTGVQPVSPHITGTVTNRERIALPPTAVIKVQLVDVSRADAPAIVLGEQIVEVGTKQVPFAFEIPYDPARIEWKHTYAVQARIEVDGRLWFVSETHYPVITRGAPIRVDMVLKAVAPARSSGPQGCVVDATPDGGRIDIKTSARVRFDACVPP